MEQEPAHFTDAAALEAFGALLAPLLVPGDVVALSGGLGAGKTTLARGILRGLGHVGEVPSPSFAILQGYEPPEIRLPVAHVDLYRIEAAEEIAELGLFDWLADGAALIEWPEHGGAALLRGALHFHIEPDPSGGRRLTARVPAAWEQRWPLLLR